MEDKKLQEETLADAAKQDNERKIAPKKKPNWKQVSLGGVSGILLGAASTALMGFSDAEDIEEISHPTEAEDAEMAMPNITVDGLPVAESVNDEMSFGDAFASARAETGAGGVFFWRGGIYGTYLADEWNAMTSEERTAFGEHIHYGTASNEVAEVEAETEVITDIEVEAEVAEVDTPETMETGNVELTTEDIVMAEEDVSETESEESGTSAQIETLETDAFIPGQDLGTDDLQQLETQNDQNIPDNGPDYINDANVSGFELV